jgi:hypothetical protein
VMFVFNCEILFCDRPASESSTYFLLATSPSPLGADVVRPVIVFALAEITISPTDIPLCTLKVLVVIVPYVPYDLCY